MLSGFLKRSKWLHWNLFLNWKNFTLSMLLHAVICYSGYVFHYCYTEIEHILMHFVGLMEQHQLVLIQTSWIIRNIGIVRRQENQLLSMGIIGFSIASNSLLFTSPYLGSNHF
ncbi:unnamed protein product [Heterobilharzia americana]|nr:unnamed protein product [Heterobilharzia americana]